MILKSLLLTVVIFITGQSHAALPIAVDGQALPSLAPMLEKITPAVVNISTRGKILVRNSILSDPLFKRFFNLPDIQSEKETMSLGSGVIVDASNGYILTNNHVIEDAIEITVTLRDGREVTAEVLGRDPDTDIAVIKINAKHLKSISLGDSSHLRVGDFVVAIGNPYGLGQTVTSGIVSALGRSGLGIESYEDFIQTDASINVGNSGGALVNLRGELIGINTAILGSGEGNQGSIGIGFAIPINMASDIMSQLIEYGEVKRGRLGVNAQDLTPELAKAFNIDSTQGAIVTQIEQGSPAQKGGVKVGDVIIKANGRRVRSSVDMHNLVGLMRVDQNIELEVIRGGRVILVKATIQQMEIVTVDGSEFSFRLAGASIGEIKETDIQEGKLEYLQVMAVELDSQAWKTGLRKDDIIYSINKQLVNTFEQAFAAAKSSRSLLINIQRGNQAMYILIK
ncbi:MAG: DegQ family serine endoprotease [Gammaproteobacteria bacterium]|jgi:serine protease Do/serine protease DegQ|nr:DegQ family serine endoprotease [Gammaproteobacteria bacterium]MBT3725756.1 DegQ family serine endoprotease [Gammaproteobacteria bacterium]MBT4077156.1 DegQ family serine endoprotease [Gammaproteobacteria bacterium]MBT4196074.1 DegQ family serine endoprotease [Gammaproteobacteria bacterium]MBT4448821.1 DegQ family serine endoprotease [Gammaproteobacteria bacterium]